MKKLSYLLIIFGGLFSACNLTDSRTNLSSTSKILPESNLLPNLKLQKTIIDTLFSRSNDKLIVLVLLTDNKEPIKVKNGKFPDNVQTTFNILKDSTGHIVTISEFPFSESGDWDIIYTHYFDKDGKTFAFERNTSFFNSLCTYDDDGIAYETLTEFYNKNFQLIDKTYRLVDEKDRSLKKDSCQFPYDYEYKISSDIDNYLLKNRIKKTKEKLIRNKG